MQKTVSTERAMKNAFASARMEGFRVTPEIQRDCQRIVSGEISIDDCVKQMLAKPSRKRID